VRPSAELEIEAVSSGLARPAERCDAASYGRSRQARSTDRSAPVDADDELQRDRAPDPALDFPAADPSSLRPVIVSAPRTLRTQGNLT